MISMEDTRSIYGVEGCPKGKDALFMLLTKEKGNPNFRCLALWFSLSEIFHQNFQQAQATRDRLTIIFL